MAKVIVGDNEIEVESNSHVYYTDGRGERYIEWRNLTHNQQREVVQWTQRLQALLKEFNL